MKRIILCLGFCLTLIANAFAADNIIDQLNEQVVNILAPFQNETTVAQLTFSAMETNADHAVKVAVSAFYSKAGSENLIEVKLDNLSYDYNEGLAPKTIFKGSFGFDFTNFLSQDMINTMCDRIVPYVEEMMKGYYLDYFGDAVTVRGVVTSATKDARGNYTGLTGLFSVKIDLNKLSDDQRSEDIFATEAVLSFTINAKTGVMIDSFVVNNPAYVGFNKGQIGLKEFLDKLVASDEEVVDLITEFVEKLDRIAGSAV